MKTQQNPTRISSIDLLRGFALLGILLMNMSSFAMPSMAYFNPNVYGGDDWLNRAVFGLCHIFADQKMMAIFSILFGASVVLVTSRLEERGKGSFLTHYIRNFWLLIIGLLHSILIWDGDILMLYALCAFILYWVRKLKPVPAALIGLLIFLLPSGLSLLMNELMQNLSVIELNELQQFWNPDPDMLNHIIAFYKGPYIDQLFYRLSQIFGDIGTDDSLILDLFSLVEAFCRALGMMLMGMAMFKSGILSGELSSKVYKAMAGFGLGIGVPVGAASLHLFNTNNWDPVYSLFIGRIPNHIATIFIAIGYIGLIMLWSKSGMWKHLQTALQSVGRMALSNYIGQSIISTFLFYGFGLGFFGCFRRLPLMGVILLIWAFQMVFSYFWMKHFRYGPLEWAWRSLTKFKLQKIR